jgi:formate hydrogenlyase subunit 3/multisubunit Na+/H+ antiporter MnhD subunit
MIIPLVLLSSLTIGLGVFGGYFLDISREAADQLMNPDNYINSELLK